MMKAMQQESDYKSLLFSEDRAINKIIELIGWGFVVVAEKDGQVIGGMVGDTVKPIWSEDLIGLDFGFYIKPEHRGHNYAAQMVKAFEFWCSEMGAKQVRPAVSTANAAAGRLYKGLGFKPVGEQFMKEV
jgi:RimJ/RimL family protein N-acetyltransferase